MMFSSVELASMVSVTVTVVVAVGAPVPQALTGGAES